MIDFSLLSDERAAEFRDHVVAREPFFLQELARWMAATGGPVDAMDASAESLVDLWEWFAQFVDADLPGVPHDARSAEYPLLEPSTGTRISAAADRMVHYVRLVAARYDAPAPWAVRVRQPGEPREFFDNVTGIQRSDGQVTTVVYVRNAGAKIPGRTDWRVPGRLLELVQMRFPEVVTGAQRGESVLAPYLTADLGPMPPEAAVTPVLRWATEPAPAPGNPAMVKQPQLVIMRGPAAGLEDPRLLEPLDERVVAAALAELGYVVDGRAPRARDLRVDEASFVAQDEDWYSEVSVAVHRRRLRLVDVDQTAATAERWERLVAGLRTLAGQLGAAVGEPDDFDFD